MKFLSQIGMFSKIEIFCLKSKFLSKKSKFFHPTSKHLSEIQCFFQRIFFQNYDFFVSNPIYFSKSQLLSKIELFSKMEFFLFKFEFYEK